MGAAYPALFPPYKRSARTVSIVTRPVGLSFPPSLILHPNQNPNILPGMTLIRLPATRTGDAFWVIVTACCFWAADLTVPSRYASWPISLTVTVVNPAAYSCDAIAAWLACQSAVVVRHRPST